MNISEVAVTAYEEKERAGVDEFIIIANEDNIIFRFGKGDKVVSDSYPVSVLKNPKCEDGLQVQLYRLWQRLV